MTDRRRDLIRALRWIADQPGGIAHRGILFAAALMLDRDVTITWVDRRTPEKETECEDHRQDNTKEG